MLVPLLLVPLLLVPLLLVPLLRLPLLLLPLPLRHPHQLPGGRPRIPAMDWMVYGHHC